MQVKKQQLELDMEQHPGSKLGKEYIKAVYCHSAYLNWTDGLNNYDAFKKQHETCIVQYNVIRVGN